MSKQSLSELAREMRAKEKVGNYNVTSQFSLLCQATPEQSNSFSPSPHTTPSQGVPLASLCHAAPPTIKIELDDEMQILFLKLKKKFGNHFSNKEVLRRILKETDANNQCKLKNAAKQDRSNYKRNNKNQKMSEKGYNCQYQAEQKWLNKAKNITSKKFSRENDSKENPVDVKQREVAPQNVSKHRKTDQETTTNKTPSRYIPAHIKKAAIAKGAGKCAYPGCLRPAEIFHHTKRFSESKDNPFARQSVHQSVIPLCKAHHEFAHNGLIGNEEKSVGQWRLNMEAGVSSYADALYRSRRRE
jgi:hypothetical protein